MLAKGGLRVWFFVRFIAVLRIRFKIGQSHASIHETSLSIGL